MRVYPEEGPKEPAGNAPAASAAAPSSGAAAGSSPAPEPAAAEGIRATKGAQAADHSTADSWGELVIVNGRQSGARRPLSRPLTFLGRSPGCDLRLNVEGVAPYHCLLAMEGDRLTLRDLESGAGTFVNGKRVARTDLRDGDLVVLGPFHFKVKLTPPAFRPAQAEPSAAPDVVLPRDAVRVQAAAVAAQHVALAEEEAKLQQRRSALEKQEEQLASHLEDKRRKLMQLGERTQAERAALEQERAAFEQRMERVTGDLTPVQRELLQDQARLQAERKRLVETHRRIYDHWRRRWQAERDKQAERVQALRAEARLVQEAVAGLEKREQALAARRLRFHALYELGRRHLREAWDRLRQEQHRWKHRRGKERAALKVRERELEAAALRLEKAQQALVKERTTWETRQRVLQEEVEGLDARARNLRVKVFEQQEELARLDSEMQERRDKLAELPPVEIPLAPETPPPDSGNHAPGATAVPPPARSTVPPGTGAPLHQPPALTARILAEHARQTRAARQAARKAPPAPVEQPARNPAPASDLDEQCRRLDRVAADLADQRLQLIEQWHRLTRLQRCWEDERQEARAELEKLTEQLLEKGHVLVQQEQANQQADQVLRQRHEELVQVRQHLIAWRARLRVREKTWEGERQQLLLEVRKREEQAERQLNTLVDLRQRWARRRRQEVARLQEERRLLETLRQEYAMNKVALCDRTSLLEEEKRILAEKALALEQYKQEFLSKIETPLAERRIERLRRRWLTQNADVIRATMRDREALKQELTALEARYTELHTRADEVNRAEVELAEKQAAWEHKQALAAARQSRLQDELKNAEAQRTLSAQQVAKIRDEVERIARSLIDEPDPPVSAAVPRAA